MNRVVLVTGGAGYVGSHACKALAAAGYKPVTLDNFSHGHRWAVKYGPFVEADLHDSAALNRAFIQHQPSAVLHFAALAYVGESVKHPQRYYHNNVLGTYALLECMRRHNVMRIVFSSTCSVYGTPGTVPIPERHPRFPINPYGRTKLHIEHMLQDYANAYGLHSVSLRYFNAAGADRDGEIGEVHQPETHLIPLVLEVAAGTRPHIVVNGRDYATPDGTCIRDYVHVSDLAHAHVLALETLEHGHGAHSYNLGTGRGHSVQQVIDVVKQVTGRPIAYEDGPRRSGDPPNLVADPERATNRLRWTPQYTELSDIVHTAWAWVQSNQA